MPDVVTQSAEGPQTTPSTKLLPLKANCPVCAQFPIEDHVWVKILSKPEYAVMRRHETLDCLEQTQYTQTFEEGRFHCKGCRLTLFDNSVHLADNGGNPWPTFKEPFTPACLNEKDDKLICQRCDSYMGKKDDAGNYVANSLSLQFIPKESGPAKKYPVTFTEEEWRAKLNKEEYEVLREAATELPDVNEFVNHFEPGHYECKGCGNKLFSSEHKFQATCGWPAFNKPMSDQSCEYSYDYNRGFRREECLCQQCGSHLGHRFYDAHDQDTGIRYCINSICINFISA
eukprot:Protomagalhaensia_sp_Gyna_25__2449@NODE_2366_length_1126_cov_689_549218_g1961_i0_p1_GENE_NODE_2366_length_1126_cov_689_549218_g1961_i0NODE_2366_length_1126_cov_689_549218_g1961_i0_p1_ORF_typecomplete_len286_score33_58SelR/PF01641_18/6_4e14SelR/PF01641_18/7_4e41HECT_2/PF09814_9/14HECT_2/PF09814_9/0_96HECT_2/PF09814_9/8_2HECT_2/PF09814_9/0_94YippeeMis18/PF03226_14/1_1e02YippeeMis18/PF03226_14/0_041Ribosomal_L37e/PF01907_19/1_2e03Ribosomal_L37e/PF01907_19/0_064Ribosomal_L37e/PF01907_19/1_2e03GFA/PF